MPDWCQLAAPVPAPVDRYARVDARKGEPNVVSLIKALTDTFKLPSESVREWGTQIRKLTNKDRADFAAMFEAAGTAIDPDSIPIKEQ